MKTIISITLLSVLTFSINGQVKTKKADVLWGIEENVSKKTTLSDVVAYDETGIYVLKEKIRKQGKPNSDITLVHYNNEMNPVRSVSHSLAYQKKEMNYEFIIPLADKLYMFSSFQSQKSKKNYLFIQSINKETLELNDDLKEIAEINYEGRIKLNADNFGFEQSRDSSRFLVYYNLPFKQGDKERFGFNVLDEQMNLIWNKEIKLNYNEELFEVEDYEVDNEGNVYILGAVFKNVRIEKRQGDPNYHYSILSFTDKGENTDEYIAQVPGKFLTDMQIEVNNQQDIICGGFYSEEGTFSIKGSYFLRIDGSKQEIITKSFKEFGIDFITQHMTPRQEKKKKRKDAKGKNVELFNYWLDDMIIRDDGGAMLIGEQFRVITVVTTTTGANGAVTTTSTTYYHYNDIIIINISPNGEIEWTEKIPKRQVSSNDGGFYLSYALSVIADKLYFVFNDDPRNLYYTGEGKVHSFTKGKESIVTMVELDRDGNQTREALVTGDDAEILTRPKVCEQISDHEMVLFNQKRRKHQFGKVTFK